MIRLVPLLLASPALAAPALQDPDPPMQQPRVRAPELEGREWLNTEKPLRLREELAGHVVLLDFWTYCCINCMHVLPDLAALEEEFAEEPFAVVGVHSAKFEEENDPQNIRQAILRYGIEHPVVVDEQMKIWRSYAVRAWPTLVLVDPEGYYYGAVSGEGNLEILRQHIQSLLAEHREKGTLAEKPMRTKLEEAPEGELLFPGKVLAAGDRLYVADSSHHRVLEVDPADGRILREFGRKAEPGLADGAPEAARFRNPQGMARLDGALYVADTENHALRRIDLETGAVDTVAGTGEQARPFPTAGPGLETALNSPWALEPDGSRLHVAMAGSHQLWTLDTESGEIAPLAGSGRENIVDGPAAEAQLAQPSGLARVGRRLYFADSEVSAVRWVDLDEQEVGTVIGSGLFDFGDADGGPDEARLQHPLGVAAWNGGLLVADSYNHKIKRLDPETRRAETLLGTGEPGPDGEAPRFYEPGGLDVAGDTLYVADTNHHRVLAIELPTKKWRVVLGGRPAEAAPAAAPAAD